MEFNMEALPNEILVKIFSYVPIGTLFRFASICKRWRELIHEFYLQEENQKNWSGVAETWVDPRLLGESVKHAPWLAQVRMEESENAGLTSRVDYKEVVAQALHRRVLLNPDFDAKRICYRYGDDPEDNHKFTTAKVSGDVVVLYSSEQELLSLNTIEGEVLKTSKEPTVRCIELAAVYSGNVKLGLDTATAYHDHIFILTVNGLIKLVELARLRTVGVITMYQGLQIASVCYDEKYLYVYDGHYGISAFSVPGLQRMKRFSVDGLNSYYVANNTLVYVEDSGRYHNPKMEVGFSYKLLPFSISMVNYVTPVLDGVKIELPDFFESKIFRIDCVLISVPPYTNYLTMNGEDYRIINVDSLHGKASCVTVSGPTLVVGTTFGKLLIYHVPNSKTFMSCDFERPLVVFPALNDKPVRKLEVFDTREGFGIFASDGDDICTYFFPRDI